MSAGDTGAIGPVSARYAAQIRELLYAQAIQRMAADQEAARARAEADRQAAAQSAAKAEELRQPLRAKVEPPEAAPLAPPVQAAAPRLSDAPVETGQAPPAANAPAQIVDIQA